MSEKYTNEVWKPVKEINGKYHVSNCGRIRSHIKFIRDERGVIKGYSISKNGKIRKGSKFNGYLAIDSSINGKRKILYVHRLVAKYFIENPADRNEVNHKDGNKLNNYYENLEWCTHGENMKHASNKRLIPMGEKSPQAKLTRNDVLDIRNAFNIGFTLSQITEAYPTTRDNIRAIINRKSWKHI